MFITVKNTDSAVEYFKLVGAVDALFGNQLHTLQLKEEESYGVAGIFENKLFLMAGVKADGTHGLFAWDYTTGKCPLSLFAAVDEDKDVIVAAILNGIRPTHLINHYLNGTLSDAKSEVLGDLYKMMRFSVNTGVEHK